MKIDLSLYEKRAMYLYEKRAVYIYSFCGRRTRQTSSSRDLPIYTKRPIGVYEKI